MSGRAAGGADVGSAGLEELLGLGPAQAWPAGPASISFLSPWHQEMLEHTASKVTEPPTASLPRDPKAPSMEEGGEETPPQQGGLRWPGKTSHHLKVLLPWDSCCYFPARCWAPRLTSSPPLLQPDQGSTGMVQPRGGSGTRCQGDSWAPGADLACETSPCPPNPRVLPGALAGTQHPELITDTALSPWRSQVL